MGVLGDHTGIKLNTKVPRMIQEVRYWSWGGHIIHTTAGALLLLLPFSKRVIQKVALFSPCLFPSLFLVTIARCYGSASLRKGKKVRPSSSSSAFEKRPVFYSLPSVSFCTGAEIV